MKKNLLVLPKDVATKKDLHSLRIELKEDIRDVRTEIEDLARSVAENFVTKDEFYTAQQRTEQLMENLRVEIKTEIQTKFDVVITGQDKILGILQTHGQEQAFTTHRMNRLEDTVRGHGKRITVLEGKK